MKKANNLQGFGRFHAQRCDACVPCDPCNACDPCDPCVRLSKEIQLSFVDFHKNQQQHVCTNHADRTDLRYNRDHRGHRDHRDHRDHRGRRGHRDHSDHGLTRSQGSQGRMTPPCFVFVKIQEAKFARSLNESSDTLYSLFNSHPKRGGTKTLLCSTLFYGRSGGFWTSQVGGL